MSQTLEPVIKRFASLFDGYTKAHGRYNVTRVEPSGKHSGDPTKDRGTHPGPVTPEIWEEHLTGTGPGLGVIMLRDDDTCVFAVIDIDDKLEDHDARVAQIKKLNLPLVVCRSKSGGAHLYLFCKEPIPALLIQTRMAEWCAALGLSAKTEIFPKQNARANKEDPGSWINIPYQNGNKTVRFGINNGQRLTMDEFLDLAESSRVDAAYFDRPYYKQPDEPTDLFWEGPPCLVTIQAQGGFAEGTSNDGMMAVGVYLRKRFPEDWVNKLREYNTLIGRQDEAEIKEIERSLQKKDYHYRCKLAPINSVCQRRACLGRRYGIGDTSFAQGGVAFLGLTRYEYSPPDPPMWAFEINGKRVMVDNDTFYQRDALNRAVLAQANTVPLHMPPARWLKELNSMAKEADVLSMPEDAGPTGQLWERIQMFLEQGVPALTREELLSGGKVWREHGKVHFRGTDLFQYFDTHRIKFKSEQAVWQILRECGAHSVPFRIGDKIVKVWQIEHTAIIERHIDRAPLPTGEEF